MIPHRSAQPDVPFPKSFGSCGGECVDQALVQTSLPEQSLRVPKMRGPLGWHPILQSTGVARRIATPSPVRTHRHHDNMSWVQTTWQCPALNYVVGPFFELRNREKHHAELAIALF